MLLCIIPPNSLKFKSTCDGCLKKIKEQTKIRGILKAKDN